MKQRIHYLRTKGWCSLRVFKLVILVRNLCAHPLLFSERNGYIPMLCITYKNRALIIKLSP